MNRQIEGPNARGGMITTDHASTLLSDYSPSYLKSQEVFISWRKCLRGGSFLRQDGVWRSAAAMAQLGVILVRRRPPFYPPAKAEGEFRREFWN